MKTQIRNLFLVIIIGFSISVISSCKKDNETEVTTVDPIVGTWNFGESNIEITNGEDELILFLTTTYDISADSAQELIYYMYGDFEMEQISGTITFNSDQTYKVTGEDTDEMGSWSKSSDGKKLSINNGEDEEQEFNIRELTSASLIFGIPIESEYLDLDDNGTEETRLDIEMVLRLYK